MSKKKRFGISQAMGRGLTDTVNLVERNPGKFRSGMIPMSRIETDPDNPRQLSLNIHDIQQGLNKNDPDYERKRTEFEMLEELAETIRKSGIINPIVVYKRDQNYRIVAGERRFLASMIAGKTEIDARIYNEKPIGLDLKLVQWYENTARADLSLHERVQNVEELIKAYVKRFSDQSINDAKDLKELVGLSLNQARYYLNVIKAPEDVKNAIANGQINSLDKAAAIANVGSNDIRTKALFACLNGASLKDIRAVIAREKENQSSLATSLKSESRGRAPQYIQLGKTKHFAVVREIIEAVLRDAKYSHHSKAFANAEWDDYANVSTTFKEFLKIVELETME
ncbi:MAG: ParB/RepB/Spo0J family partition protein [Gammaproteobacteria bacterium]